MELQGIGPHGGRSAGHTNAPEYIRLIGQGRFTEAYMLNRRSNLFPSNIQGLPTWYEIRVNGRGYTARSRTFDLFVTVNPASYERDIREVREGGWVMHDSSWPLREELRRPDVTFLDVPMAALCREHFQGDRERILMKNILYVGALGALLELDLEVVRGLLEETFARKKALLESNFLALELGYDHVKAHLPSPLPIRPRAMDATPDATRDPHPPHPAGRPPERGLRVPWRYEAHRPLSRRSR